MAVLLNTDPPIDEPAMVEFVARRARQVKLGKVYPYAAITKRLAGHELAEIGLKAAGAVAFTDGVRSGQCTGDAARLGLRHRVRCPDRAASRGARAGRARRDERGAARLRLGLADRPPRR